MTMFLMLLDPVYSHGGRSDPPLRVQVMTRNCCDDLRRTLPSGMV
uniref:Uncharacterized protein n=1 Tax=Anguilla anguilla TaxID=7936 RepID=A0A0E9XTR6_ANGAN